MIAAKLFLLAALLWCIAALIIQVIRAWSGGRHDYSRQVGSPMRGVAYSFTAAMMPNHKESIRLHPIEFGIGIIMHLGAVVAMIGVILLLIAPEFGQAFLNVLRPASAVGLLAGLVLFVRRLRSSALRAMSVPDDYAAVLATCVLVAGAILPMGTVEYRLAFMIYGGLLLIYLPLGKLRHAVFFFVARGHYGHRLGYRGVYPPASAGQESCE